jgi:hypothetical protein
VILSSSEHLHCLLEKLDDDVETRGFPERAEV